MTNDCIRIGLERGAHSLKRLSLLAYQEQRDRYGTVPAYYCLCAISKAAGILAARQKSMRRGYVTKRPYLSKPVAVSCYGFKVQDGSLLIPLGQHRFEAIGLNRHTLGVLAEPGARARSFTITEKSLSICIAKEVERISVHEAVGVDRNLGNVTVGNTQVVTYYDISKTVTIAETTRSVVRSFRRNDARVRRMLFRKYERRRRERVGQILNRASKQIVSEAKKNRQVIAFEEMKGIRRLYRRGSSRGRDYRRKMNAWPFGELKRQVEYKAAWEGVPVVTLSVNETRGTTMDCPRCGERLQAAGRDDDLHHRQLWCNVCGRWDDRDLVAVMNISHRGWMRFVQSQGEAGEAVKGNPDGGRQPVVLRVDASKPSSSQMSKS